MKQKWVDITDAYFTWSVDGSQATWALLGGGESNEILKKRQNIQKRFAPYFAE